MSEMSLCLSFRRPFAPIITTFFFFQAEDGIRDIGVTGVQTCALPISPDDPDAPITLSGTCSCYEWDATIWFDGDSWHISVRSEERRVGKECRSRWSRDD